MKAGSYFTVWFDVWCNSSATGDVTFNESDSNFSHKHNFQLIGTENVVLYQFSPSVAGAASNNLLV